MKTKRWIILAILIVCLCYFFLHPGYRWVGYSKGGDWKAVLYKDHRVGKYFGDFKWSGPVIDRKKVKVVFAQYRENGKYSAGGKTIPEADWGFVGFADAPKKNEKVEEVIHWMLNGKKHKAMIQLHRKLQLFSIK